ncbi:MAG TPA: lipoprotein [Longimicrobium sp.]|nr:lipoprotein [Longimicrobium sp.]
MKRSILLLGAALLLAGCPSGADVAEEEDAAPDSAAIEVIGDHPPARDSQTPAVPTP